MMAVLVLHSAGQRPLSHHTAAGRCCVRHVQNVGLRLHYACRTWRILQICFSFDNSPLVSYTFLLCVKVDLVRFLIAERRHVSSFRSVVLAR